MYGRKYGKEKMNHNQYHQAFDLCANALHYSAKKLDPYWPGGMNYVKINVLIFCVACPIIFMGSVALNIILAMKLLSRGH